MIVARLLFAAVIYWRGFEGKIDGSFGVPCGSTKVELTLPQRFSVEFKKVSLNRIGTAKTP
jgi:hypothetical protein